MKEQGYLDISAEELQEYLQHWDEDRYLLVDVRLPKEYRQGHIPGAQLIPVGELAARIHELAPDRDVIFY